MIVYGASLSPFVRKVLAYGAEKGLELDHKPIGLGSDDPDFLAASPFRKIPAFSDGDFGISDSSAIIHYLEAKYPEPALIPAEPEARARTIWFDEFADTILCACGAKMFFNRIVAPRFLGREGDLEAADKAEREELPPILEYLERTLPENGFLVGEGITLADIAVATAFANFRHLGMTIDAGCYPKVAAFAERMLARPSFSGWVERETAFLERTAA
ncbi:MAG TPA: glutathione S-transferase family protein [Allosphingosinicella sp.]|nr:glutathione S-transferase family protein [Allosphingosinicella sp.]